MCLRSCATLAFAFCRASFAFVFFFWPLWRCAYEVVQPLLLLSAAHPLPSSSFSGHFGDVLTKLCNPCFCFLPRILCLRLLFLATLAMCLRSCATLAFAFCRASFAFVFF